MATSKIGTVYTVGGVAFTGKVERTESGQWSVVLDLPAGVAGAFSDAVDGGVDGLPTGHGFEIGDVVDLHWTDPTDGSYKSLTGYLLDAASANAIEFSDIQVPIGDSAPAEDTPVVVSKQYIGAFVFDGDSITIVASGSSAQSTSWFLNDALELILTQKHSAGEVWSWTSDSVAASPFAGETMSDFLVSNGTTTPCKFRLAILYDGV